MLVFSHLSRFVFLSRSFDLLPKLASASKLLLFKLEGFLCLLELYVLCLFQYELVFESHFGSGDGIFFFVFV